jgi:hypothetical protein
MNSAAAAWKPAQNQSPERDIRKSGFSYIGHKLGECTHTHALKRVSTFVSRSAFICERGSFILAGRLSRFTLLVIFIALALRGGVGGLCSALRE